MAGSPESGARIGRAGIPSYLSSYPAPEATNLRSGRANRAVSGRQKHSTAFLRDPEQAPVFIDVPPARRSHLRAEHMTYDEARTLGRATFTA